MAKLILKIFVVLDFERDSTIRLHIPVEVDEKKVETDENSFLEAVYDNKRMFRRIWLRDFNLLSI